MYPSAEISELQPHFFSPSLMYLSAPTETQSSHHMHSQHPAVLHKEIRMVFKRKASPTKYMRMWNSSGRLSIRLDCSPESTWRQHKTVQYNPNLTEGIIHRDTGINLLAQKVERNSAWEDEFHQTERETRLEPSPFLIVVQEDASNLGAIKFQTQLEFLTDALSGLINSSRNTRSYQCKSHPFGALQRFGGKSEAKTNPQSTCIARMSPPRLCSASSSRHRLYRAPQRRLNLWPVRTSFN